MKNLKKYILVLLLITVFGACTKDFLELVPQDRLTADGYYRDADEVRSGTASLYGYPWFGFNDKFFWLAGDCMPGNLYYTYDQEGQYYYFTFTAGNAYLSDAWKSLYRVISYANSIINDVPRIASNHGVEQSVIDGAVDHTLFNPMI